MVLDLAMDTQALPFYLPNLPSLLPDETLYSWCGHVHLWNGNSNVLKTSRQLFGTPYAALLHDFPACLNILQNKTYGHLGSSKTLALHHTLLGYFLAFQDEETSKNIITKVCKGSYPQLKYKLGIPASRIGGAHPLKFCQHCLNEDRSEYGRAFWHLQHQFPSSLACYKHAYPLSYIQTPQSPVHQREWLLPEAVTGAFPLPIDNDAHLSLLVKLSTFSNEAAKLQPSTFTTQALSWTYQSRIKEEGMLTAKGNLRMRLLNAAVCEYYSGLESFPGFHILTSLHTDTGGFAGSMARKQPRAGHPFKHLLLISMLFKTWDEFIGRYQEIKLNPPEWINPPDKVNDDQDDPRLNEFTHLATVKGFSVTAAAHQVGISTTTGTQWAKRHNVHYTARTKKLHPAILSKVRNKLKRGALKKNIVDTIDISLVSLNRLLASEPELLEAWQSALHKINQKKYRKSFLKTVRVNPGLPIKQIRKIPGNGYQWLYMHDREWLIEHIPSLWN